MNLRNLNDLDKVEKYLNEIRGFLNPEDSPYVCDTIVTNIGDQELNMLIADMLKRMGYKKGTIIKTMKIVKRIQK